MTKTECEARLLCLGTDMEMRKRIGGSWPGPMAATGHDPGLWTGVAGNAQPGMSSPSQPRPHRAAERPLAASTDPRAAVLKQVPGQKRQHVSAV